MVSNKCVLCDEIGEVLTFYGNKKPTYKLYLCTEHMRPFFLRGESWFLKTFDLQIHEYQSTEKEDMYTDIRKVIRKNRD